MAKKEPYPRCPSPRWLLVLTSMLIGIAGIVGLVYQQYNLGMFALMASVFSINFYRDEDDTSVRLSMDRIVAWTTLYIYTTYAIIYFPNFGYEYKIAVMFFLTIIPICFCTSNYLSSNNDINWVYVHMLYHVLTFIGQIIMVHAMCSINE